MMRGIRGLLTVLATALPLPVEASPVPDDSMLEVKSQARACYLGFVHLYDIDYLRGPAAGEPARRCVRLSYLRAFPAAALAEATDSVFRERHGDAVAAHHRAGLARVGEAYRPVRPGDRYTYCVDPGGAGTLLRDGHEVLRLESGDFAERYLQIWVRGEDEAHRPVWGFTRC